METILITGASGLLGRAVVERLAQEREYRVISACSRRNMEISGNGGG